MTTTARLSAPPDVPTENVSEVSVSEVSTARLRQPWSRRGALFLLKAYQGAASGRVSTCRYYPSCSNYAVEAFSVHRFWRAFGLTGRRLLRCRPFGPHGIDLVPLPDGAVSAVTHECEAGRGEVSPAREVHQPC
jgi:putative membrane protein insertion efficiency factor